MENGHLLDYAAARGIDADIVREHCVEVHYCFEKNPREKYALGFANNDHGGFELRNSMFKGCATAKDITGLAQSDRSCAVFEGFFDLLSFKQYAKGIPRCRHWESWTCVLNSTSIVERSKDFLSRYTKRYTLSG